MGNENSTQINKVDDYDTEKNVDFLAEFYGKDDEMTDDEMNLDKNYYRNADEIYGRVKPTSSDIYVQRRIEIFVDPIRGRVLPYESRNTNFGHNMFEQATTSENPKYVEFIVCNSDLQDIRKKYAVNKSMPGPHDAESSENCEYHGELFEMSSEKKASEKMRRPAGLSATSSNAMSQNQGVFSQTSTAAKPSHLIHGGTCGIMHAGANNAGPADTSPEEILDSDENDKAFSDTSDMTTTTTSPAMPGQKKKQTGETVDEDAGDAGEADEADEAEVEAIIEDETDDDDEDLEDLDDEVTEEGLILDQSDISSTDLYRMQSRIFGSETSEFKPETEKEYTDRVEEAMDAVERNTKSKSNTRTVSRSGNARKNTRKRNIFNSEDNEILNMNSSTDKYMKRPTKKSNKYT